MAGVEIRKRVIGGPEARGKVQGNISSFTVEPLTVLIGSVVFVGVVLVLHIAGKFIN